MGDGGSTDDAVGVGMLGRGAERLRPAAVELKGDREIVLVAVAQTSYALQHATVELKGDHEIVLVAMPQDGYALQYATAELQNGAYRRHPYLKPSLSCVSTNTLQCCFSAAVCVQVVTGAFGPDENLPAAIGEATAKSGECECEVFAQQVDSNAFQTVSVHHRSSAHVQHPHSATRADNARKHAQLFALGSATAVDSFSAKPTTQSPPVATPAPPKQ